MNYNSPFSDEAIYIVIGKLGLFQWDWTSYSAANWMAGSLYAYPPLTAIAYSGLGIIGSRLLSVIFGLITVFAISRIAGFYTQNIFKSAVESLTAITFGFSTICLAISRLATYDIPAVCLITVSWYYLEKAYRHSFSRGQWYFISAITLIMAVMMKIVVILYAPFLFFLAIYHLHQSMRHTPRRKHSKIAKYPPKPLIFYYLRYFLLPLIIMSMIYLLTHTSHLTTYITTHQNAENIPFVEIFQFLLPKIVVLFPLWLVATLFLFHQRRLTFWLITNIAANWIIIFHFFTHRLATFDKHLIFTYGFTAILIGVGLGPLITSPFHTHHNHRFIPVGISFLLIVYLAISITQGYRYGLGWANTNQVSLFLNTRIQPKDYILSEEGQVTMLATYNQNHPLHTATLDWYSYQGYEGNDAYSRAIKDAHFNYLVLYRDPSQLNETHQPIHKLITQTKDNTYIPVFDDDTFIVYARVYQ